MCVRGVSVSAKTGWSGREERFNCPHFFELSSHYIYLSVRQQSRYLATLSRVFDTYVPTSFVGVMLELRKWSKMLYPVGVFLVRCPKKRRYGREF